MSNADWAYVINHFNDPWRALWCRTPTGFRRWLQETYFYRWPKIFFATFFFAWSILTKDCTNISMFHHNQNFLLNNHKKPMWQNHNLTQKWNGILNTVEHIRTHTHTKLIHICFWQNNNGNGNNCYFQAEITSWKNKLIYNKHKYSKTSEGMIIWEDIQFMLHVWWWCKDYKMWSFATRLF